MVEADPGPLGPEWDLAWVTPSIVPGTAINVAAPTRKRKRVAGSTKWRKYSVTLCFLFLMLILGRGHAGTDSQTETKRNLTSIINT